MSRYRGPRLKITRRLGQPLSGLVQKISNRPEQPPGEHGNGGKLVKLSQYALRLQEKQKLRFYYGLTETQLLRYVQKARRAQGSTGVRLLEFINRRLDATIYLLGYAPTIRAARQLVNHGNVQVNNKRVSIPSYQCRPTDVYTCRTPQGTNIVCVETQQPFSVNVLQIVEYYSRK